MTFSISKKDLVYGFMMTILVVITSASFLAYKAMAEEADSNKIEVSEKNAQNSIVPLPELANGGAVSQDIPHLNCEAQLAYNTPSSQIYNNNVPYNLDFYRGAFFAGFQDVNGDNLPDYVFSNNVTNGAGQGIDSSYTACVYLNNGNGWEETYKCKANTQTDASGNAILKEYKGDCADTSSAGE